MRLFFVLVLTFFTGQLFAEEFVRVDTSTITGKVVTGYKKALQLVNEGDLKPDFISDQGYLYRSSRLPELEAGIRSPQQG